MHKYLPTLDQKIVDTKEEIKINFLIVKYFQKVDAQGYNDDFKSQYE